MGNDVKRKVVSHFAAEYPSHSHRTSSLQKPMTTLLVFTDIIVYLFPRFVNGFYSPFQQKTAFGP